MLDDGGMSHACISSGAHDACKQQVWGRGGWTKPATEASDRSGAVRASLALFLDPGPVFVPSETLCPACEDVTGSKGEP